MRQYSVYKDSGVEWLGKLPAEWRVKRLKYLIEGKLEYGANEVAEFEDIDLPRYIRITDFGDDGNLRQDTFKSLTTEQAKGYFLAEGDVLFARSGATVGKTFQFKQYKGLACFAGYLIKARPNRKILLSDFLYLFTKSGGYENWKSAIFNQATIQNIGADKYQNISLSVPSLEDQKLICRYLNQKIQQIDDLIAKKMRMIEFLREERAAVINQAVTKSLDPKVEMKDSGVDWLGKIPKHWETKKLKFLFRIINGATPQSSEPNYWDGDIFWATPDDFRSVRADGVLKETRRQITVAGYQNCGTAVAPQRSVIVSTRAPIGYVAVLGRDMCCNQGCRILIKRNATINERFYYFFLFVFADALASFGQGSTFKELSRDKLVDFFLLDVPQDEQGQIVDFLDKKTAQIDDQISQEERSIELLKEYRTALISEAVTGKIDVREG